MAELGDGPQPRPLSCDVAHQRDVARRRRRPGCAPPVLEHPQAADDQRRHGFRAVDDERQLQLAIAVQAFEETHREQEHSAAAGAGHLPHAAVADQLDRVVARLRNAVLLLQRWCERRRSSSCPASCLAAPALPVPALLPVGARDWIFAAVVLCRGGIVSRSRGAIALTFLAEGFRGAPSNRSAFCISAMQRGHRMLGLAGTTFASLRPCKQLGIWIVGDEGFRIRQPSAGWALHAAREPFAGGFDAAIFALRDDPVGKAVRQVVVGAKSAGRSGPLPRRALGRGSGPRREAGWLANRIVSMEVGDDASLKGAGRKLTPFLPARGGRR